jgi:hypothetical protein
MNGMDDQDPTTASPRADDVTAASAWSSSPLGDPADQAEYHPYRYNFPRDFPPDFPPDFPLDFPPDPITVAGKLKSISKATLAAGLVGTIGVGAALGMAVFVYTNSSQGRPLTVVPGSTGVPAAFATAGAPTSAASPPRGSRRPITASPPPRQSPCPTTAAPPPR